MTKKIYTIAILTILSLATHAQTFFNLTADEVRIDSVIPSFRHTIPLPDNYADSVYTVSLVYPEYINMPESQVEKFISLHGSAAPTQPLLSQKISMNRRKPFLSIDVLPYVVKDGKHKILASFMLKVKATPRKGGRKAAPRKESHAERYAANSILAEGSWAKIRVPATGIYQLTDDVIRKAGFSDPSKVKLFGYGGNLQEEVIDGDYLTRTDDLKEVPTCRVGSKRLFYGRGPVSWANNTITTRTRNPYSDYGYYFITPGTDDYHSLYERDGFSWYHGGRNLFDPEVIAEGNSKEIVFNNDRNASLASIYVKLTDAVPFSATVELNGEELGTVSRTRKLGEYDNGCEEARIYVVKSPAEKCTIKITAKTGGSIRIDYVSVTWDTPAPKPDLEKTNFPAAEYVYNITNQNHHATEATDMVIIIPTSQKLREQAERLKTFHEEHDGMRVQIVPADELYNEFSSGTPDASAYRRYLKMLYDRAETDDDMPRFLTLFGDGAWDNRMLTADWKNYSPDDFLLCYESENSFSETKCYVSDDYFCLLDNNEGADMVTDKIDAAVGRFPVRTQQEAAILVDKVESYLKNEDVGPWQNTICFMGDDGNKNRHMNDAEMAAEMVKSNYPGYNVKKIYWDAYTLKKTASGKNYPEATRLAKDQMQIGALIMDYSGHGNPRGLSHENVLLLSDFQAPTSLRLPLWVTASCDIMPFDGQEANIGDAAMFNPNGGCIAFFGTTRTVYAAWNRPLNMSFLRHVLEVREGKVNTIGEAAVMAKNEFSVGSSRDMIVNKQQFTLLGDPAIRLAAPTANAVIDQINGEDTGTGQTATLKVGELATMTGHIEGNDGFNGVVNFLVYDAEKKIVCRINDNSETDTAMVYKDRPYTVCAGSNTVKDGQFALSFVVPKDICYSDGTALLRLFAYSNDRSEKANGKCGDFTMEGGKYIYSDDEGPRIYCYLENETFTDGGVVGETPFFYAMISDNEGVNTSDVSIGHNIELCIDGRTDLTYNMNTYFKYSFGDYTTGSVEFTLPRLTAGRHSLTLRAWDVMNNSSVHRCTFTVADKGTAEIHGIGELLLTDTRTEMYDLQGRRIETASTQRK